MLRFITLPLLTSLTYAATLPNEFPGENLYQQALPILNKGDEKLEQISTLIEANSDDSEVQKAAKELGDILQPALKLLQAASDLKHPAAQYRLGYFYQILANNQNQACLLFKGSAQQGFTPAIFGMRGSCLDRTDLEKIQDYIIISEENIQKYTQYYPQPTTYLQCLDKHPSKSPQWGAQEDYLADAYLLRARQYRTREKNKRIYYYEKAIAANGCLYAQKLLSHQ